MFGYHVGLRQIPDTMQLLGCRHYDRMYRLQITLRWLALAHNRLSVAVRKDVYSKAPCSMYIACYSLTTHTRQSDAQQPRDHSIALGDCWLERY